MVNTAARLESAAPVDGVLVDEWTFRATGRSIRYEATAPVEAKGKSDTVPVWVALEPRSIVPEQQRDQLPLVGRDTEASMMRDALDRSRHEPSTQLISVIGEPGIGKSRLVEELFAYVGALPELVTWRRGRSLSYGEGVAFWALGEMVKAEAGILESDSAQVAGQKLAEAVAGVIVDGQDGEWVGRHLRPLVGIETAISGAEGARVEAFAAWRRFVEALAEDRPTVLVFEDIHWADDALLDFIDLIADRAGAVPLLIVCTARPELLERREHWGGGKTNAQTISLTPLSDEDTGRLVGGLLDQTLLPAEVQRMLLERAEGNPLYAQEYVRMLQDRGLLVREAGGWTLIGDVVDLPESLQGIIAARLDTLNPDEKALIQDSAVVGKTAWIGAVCALTERTEWQAEELLHGLERKQLLQRIRRSSIQGETEFQFGHALTRDVAYSQIRRADRAEKHVAAAAWIERLAGERDDKAELLADHYAQALALSEALGEDTTALAPRALAALTEAGRQAAATYAHSAAVRHYQAALALTPGSDAQSQATLLLGLATALFNADEPVTEIFQDALRAQVAVEAWEPAAQVERMIGRWYQDSGGTGEEADAHLAQGAEYAGRVAPTDTMCMIGYDQAFRLVVSGRAEDGLRLVNEMIPLAEHAGLEVGRALLLIWRGSARVELGDTDGVEDMRNAATTLARHGHQGTTAAYSNLADTVRSLGDMAGADAEYGTAAEWASRFALPYYVDWVAAEQAYQAYHAARWDQAERLLAQMATPTGFLEHQVGTSDGHIKLARGEAHEALQIAVAAIGYAVTSDNDEFLYFGASLEARCHQALNNDASALGACERFLARWHESGGLTGRALELCETAAVLAIAGHHAKVRDAAMLLPAACRWRAALLLAADRRYAEAATMYENIGSHPLAADMHLLAAREAGEVGRGADAAHHAQAVLTFAAATGATLYQAQAEPFVRASA